MMPLIRWNPFAFKARAIARADAARDRGDAEKAARLYGDITRRWPSHAGMVVQLGNALKDSGAFEEAEQAYLRAQAMRPRDADCRMQRGHLAKLTGDTTLAESFYREALLLDPRLAEAADEIANIARDRVHELAASGLRTWEEPEDRPDISRTAGILSRRLGIELTRRMA